MHTPDTNINSFIWNYNNQSATKRPIPQKFHVDSKTSPIIGIKARQKMSALSIISSKKPKIGIQLQ